MRLLALIAGTILLSLPGWAGLIGFYTFEGNANDVSGNGNHGTVSGASVVASGYQGQAYEFDADSIALPFNINPSAMPQLTMGAWVYSTSSTGIRGVLSHDNGGFDRGLGMDTRGACAGACFSAFTGTGVLAGPSVTASQWVFLAVRYDQSNNTIQLDVDGTEVNGTSSLGSGLTQLTVGRNPSFSEFFNGKIDSVFVYDEVLSDTRIAEIRAGGDAAILNAVPEPSPHGLFALGATALFVLRRSRSL